MASYLKASFAICQLCLLVFSVIPLRIHGIQWPLRQVSICGSSLLSAYQTSSGSVHADATDFPWQVKLRSLGALRCGGVLIADQWVLTAASCFHGNYQPRNWNVDLAPHETVSSSNNFTTGESVLLDSFFFYGAYQQGGTLHDIALVLLHKNGASRRHQPACVVNANDDIRNLSCISVGWGSGGTGEPPAPTVRRWRVTSSERCGVHTSSIETDRHPSLCAELLDPPKYESCTGDTGAPVLCKFPDGWKVTAIVTQSVGCGGMYPQPTAFPSVQFYLSFLQKLMGLPADYFGTTATSGPAELSVTGGVTEKAVVG